MTCNNCGANLAEESKFCTSCGAPLPEAVDILLNNNGNNGNNNGNVIEIDLGGEVPPQQDFVPQKPRRKKKGIIILAAVLALAVVVTAVAFAFVGVFSSNKLAKFINILENTLEDGFNGEFSLYYADSYGATDENIMFSFDGMDEDGKMGTFSYNVNDGAIMGYTGSDFEFQHSESGNFKSGYITDLSENDDVTSDDLALQQARIIFTDMKEVIVDKDYSVLAEYFNCRSDARYIDEDEFEDRMEEIADLLEDEDYLEEKFGITEKKDGDYTVYTIDTDYHEFLDWVYEILEGSKDVFVYGEDYDSACESAREEFDEAKEQMNIKLTGEIKDSDEVKELALSVDVTEDDELVTNAELDCRVIREEGKMLFEGELSVDNGSRDMDLSVEGSLVAEDDDNAKFEFSGELKYNGELFGRLDLECHMFMDDNCNAEIDFNVEVTDGNAKNLFSAEGKLGMTVEDEHITNVTADVEARVGIKGYTVRAELKLSDFGNAEPNSDVMEKMDYYKSKMGYHDEIRWDSNGIYYYDDDYNRVNMH